MTRAPRIVLAPDSYKGSASALEIAHALGEGLQIVLPEARLTLSPMADGGEGTLDCIAASAPGRWEQVTIDAIHGVPIDARWYRTEDGRAIIESAEVLGLPLIEASTDAPPLQGRGSAALGALVSAVLDTGVHQLCIGLGGSACNDAGLGLLLALGAVGKDANNAPVAPTMEGLLALNTLDLSGLDPRLSKTTIQVLCDVDNPLLGERGASRVYGPQKGLTDADIDAVESAFQRMAELGNAQESARANGSGAAGGLGFALALIGGQLLPGANTLMDMTGLRDALSSADLVITGEGRSDEQTLSGKLPLAIAGAAHPTPTALLSGDIAPTAATDLQSHFAGCFTLVERAGSVDAALAEPLHWVREAATHIGESIDTLVAAGQR